MRVSTQITTFRTGTSPELKISRFVAFRIWNLSANPAAVANFLINNNPVSFPVSAIPAQIAPSVGTGIERNDSIQFISITTGTPATNICHLIVDYIIDEE